MITKKRLDDKMSNLLLKIERIKKPCRGRAFDFSPRKEEELCFLLVFVLEFLYTASCVHKHLFAGEKWMRC